MQDSWQGNHGTKARTRRRPALKMQRNAGFFQLARRDQPLACSAPYIHRGMGTMLETGRQASGPVAHV
jgi:hypothetical protein